MKGAPRSIAEGGNVRIPINLTNPRASTLQGNTFFTVLGLTDWDAGAWGFVDVVDGKVYGWVGVPKNLEASPVAEIVLSIAGPLANDSVRLNVATAFVSEGDSFDPAALTDATAQTVAMPATAYLRKDATFTLASQPAAGDIMVVEIVRHGGAAGDTYPAIMYLVGAFLDIAAAF